jgi:hypothetical protein
MDVHSKRQPERLVCQNPKTFLQTGRYASKTIRMQKESLRETNFEATVTRFEFPRRKVLDPGGAQQNPPGFNLYQEYFLNTAQNLVLIRCLSSDYI